MKIALLKAPGEVVLEEVAIPCISEDEALVEVRYCGICGSDIHAIPDCGLYPPGTYMGHEIVGVVSQVGRNVRGWRGGERVVVNPLYMCGECYGCRHGRWSQCDHGVEHFVGCRPGLEHAGGFAKYVRVPVPERRLSRLPDEVSFEQGSLVEPLAVSLHAVRMSAFKPREATMVLGAGMIGLGVIAHLRNAGAGLVIASEMNEMRVNLAREFGADYVLNPRDGDIREKVLGLTGGIGVDVLFECSGTEAAFRSFAKFTRRGGQVIQVGQITREVPILPTDLTMNELQIQGICCYYAEEFPMVLDFLKRGVAPVEKLITSKIKLSDIVKGFADLSRSGQSEIKVLVAPDE